MRHHRTGYRVVVSTEFARRESKGAFDMLREKRGRAIFPASSTSSRSAPIITGCQSDRGTAASIGLPPARAGQ